MTLELLLFYFEQLWDRTYRSKEVEEGKRLRKKEREAEIERRKYLQIFQNYNMGDFQFQIVFILERPSRTKGESLKGGRIHCLPWTTPSLQEERFSDLIFHFSLLYHS